MVRPFKGHPKSAFQRLAAVLVVGVAGITGAATGAIAGEPISCFQALRASSGARLVCKHDAWMTDQERDDLEKLTRGFLLDARCSVSVNMEQRLVDEAMVASDRVFEAPPQPVTCLLQTSQGPMTIGGTFAPRVVFKDGFAVDASPVLANVTGVNSYLAWPVVAYVNAAPPIKSEMTAMINLFRAKLNQRQRASR